MSHRTRSRAWPVTCPVAAAVLALAGCGGPSTPEGLPSVEDLEPFVVEDVTRFPGYTARGQCGEYEEVLAGEGTQVKYWVEGTAVRVGVFAYPEIEMAGQAVDAVAASTTPCSAEGFPVQLEPATAQDVADAVGVGVDQVTAQSADKAGAHFDRSVVDLGDGRIVLTTIGGGVAQPPSELVRVSAVAVEAARSITGLPDLDDVPDVPEAP